MNVERPVPPYSDDVPVSFPADGEKITWAISTLIGNAQFAEPGDDDAAKCTMPAGCALEGA